MDLAIMRTLVRRDLHDEDAQNYRWSDAALDRHIDRALKAYSRALPWEQKATVVTTSGSRQISVGLADVVAVFAIEYPVDRFPPRWQRFSLYQDGVTLLGDEVPDGSNCYIYYGRLHTLDSQSSTIPPQHEELVAGGAASYAAMEWAVYAINRVNVGGERVPADFLRWAEERQGYFHRELKKLKSRLRATALYPAV